MHPGSLTPRLLIAAIVVSASLTMPDPSAEAMTAPAAETAVASAQEPREIDLAGYLATSPALAGVQVDLSQVTGSITGFRVISERYAPTGTLGYKQSTFTNGTSRPQTFHTTATSVDTTNETTYTVGHTITVGATFTYKKTVGIPGNNYEWSLSTFINYAAKLENAYKVSTTYKVALMQQPIEVGAGETVVVKEWYEQGRYDATAALTLELSGDIAFTACGQTVRAPIGAVLARRAELGLAPLPSWLAVDGDRVVLTSDLTFTSTPAVRQVVEVEPAAASGESTVRIYSQPEPVFASTPEVRPLATRAHPAPSSFSGPPTCTPKTSDGSAILLPDGRILDPEWGTEIPGPQGVLFSAVSGARWHGVGTFLSAIDTAGNAYWFSRGGSFGKIPLPTTAVQTVDGVAILGQDGNVYNAGTGGRIPSPSGVRFVAVSGVHHYRDAFYFSAIGTDGNAYWSDRGSAFRRLNLPAVPVRTVDGAVLVTADGRLFTANDGREIALPVGVRPASVSGTVIWHDSDAWPSSIGSLASGYNPVVTVVDDRGNIFASVNGSPLAWRRDAGSATRDGGVGLTRDGQIFTTFYEWAPSPKTPPGVTFVAVSAGPDSLLSPTISAVASDGRIFWLSYGGPFREVDY